MNGREIARNVGSSWFNLGTNILTGLFLSPFILHRLGDAAFGVWILIFSLTGYYGLFDLGIRASVIRYVSRFAATGDLQSTARLVNTSLCLYTAIGCVTLIITAAGSYWIDSLFRIPPELHDSARWLFFMVGASVAAGFPLGVFSGVLEGLQRFYILNLTSVIATLVRTALIVLVLRRGFGLLAVAAITVCLPLLMSVVRAGIAIQALPVKFSWRYFDSGSLAQIAGYGGTTLMIMIAYKLRYKTDEVIIGSLLSSSAITYFAIADRLMDYASDAVGSLAQIFVPMSSQSDATGDTDQLRRIWILGNRACALVIFPITITFILLGRSIIAVWVGSRYVGVSYPLLVTLAIPITLAVAQGASPRILFGMAKHKLLALVVGLESIVNLLLSVLLVRRFGLIGDALGTAIPLFLTSLFVLPRLVGRELAYPVGAFLRDAYVLPVILCLPLAALLAWLGRFPIPVNYPGLALQIAAPWGVYAALLYWMHRSGRLWRFASEPAGAGPGMLLDAYQEHN
jgi:O-antigen/teichoic acid export membrane protein